VVAKLLYGSAFKAPSPYLLYATPLRPGDVVGNRRSDRKRIHTVEYQMSWRPRPLFGITRASRTTGCSTRRSSRPQGINQAATNVAGQRTLSWETRADVKHHDDVHAYAAFELVHSDPRSGPGGLRGIADRIEKRRLPAVDRARRASASRSRRCAPCR
jgi:iron complex outermembrane receptor protein